RTVKSCAVQSSKPRKTKTARWKERETQRELRRVRRRQTFRVAVASVASTADKIVGAWKTAWPVLRFPCYAILAIGVAAIVAGIGFALFLFGSVFVAHVSFIAFVLVIILGAGIAALVAVALLVLFRRIIRTPAGRYVLGGIKGAFGGLGCVLLTGLVG